MRYLTITLALLFSSCHQEERPVYVVYIVVDRSVLDSYTTDNPDSLIRDNKAQWSEKRIKETTWITSRLDN